MNILSNANAVVRDHFIIRKVEVIKPFFWLIRGWQDILRHPSISLAYGVMISAMGVMILIFASNHIYLIAAAISGFLLVGPFLSIGLLELSRQQEHGKTLNFDDSLAVLTSKITPLRHFAVTLLVISIFWFIASGLVFFVMFEDIIPSFKNSLWGGFLDMITPQQVALYLMIGGILAGIVFVLSAVSISAIIDSQITALDAMLLSIKVVLTNFPIMVVWASLIVVLTIIAFSSYLLGMIIIYPLLGHATWHAYRDLVEIKK